MASTPESASQPDAGAPTDSQGEAPVQANVFSQNAASGSTDAKEVDISALGHGKNYHNVSTGASRNLPPVPKFGQEGSSTAIMASDGKGRTLPPVPKFWESSEEQSRETSAPPQAIPALATPSEMIQPASQALVDEKLSAAEPKGKFLSVDEPPEKAGGEPELLNPKPRDSRPSEDDQINDVPVEENSDAEAGKGSSVVASLGRGDVRTSAAAGVSPSQPPYLKPPWSAAPDEPYSLEILKEGSVLGVEDVSKKGAYMFGRSDRCDFVLEHPTVSRYHAVLQFNAVGDSFVYDLGSTHGTFVNKSQVQGKEYVPLRVGDVIRFGLSSRLHVFQGPLERMPKEGPSKKKRETLRVVEAAQDRTIRAASLARGKMDARMSDGISWGMDEDAEEEEDDEDEVTWQTFKGQLTERQQKTLDKVHRHNEKLSNLKKENDAIQAKEMSQGGLTQGQQTQVARNEQRMGQLLEELESMEETLNESIRESISGRSGKPRRRNKNSSTNEDEEDDLSDDEFYDRAGKMQRKKKEAVQRVETADSLLDKKAALLVEKERLSQKIMLHDEKAAEISQEQMAVQTAVGTEDSLDQFMTTVTTKIETENTSQLQKGLEPVLKELELVERLLKISDPTGDGLRKWTMKQSGQGGNGQATATAAVEKKGLPREDDTQRLSSSSLEEKVEQINDTAQGVSAADGKEVATSPDGENVSVASDASGTVLAPLEPPLRLGAPMPEAAEEERVEISKKVQEDATNFVGYKDRKKKASRDNSTIGRDDQEIEPTLMQPTKDELAVDEHIADSVALLLRHKRGLGDANLDVPLPTENNIAPNQTNQPTKKSSKKRKKEAAGKSAQTNDPDDSSNWVPPAGQTGDGRTALNDKYGY